MKIRAIVKRPDEQFGHMTNVSNTLENFQRTVEGYIETVTLDNGVVIICNEEGLINDLPFNCWVRGISFFGTIIAVGADMDELTDIPISFREWKELLGMGALIE